MAGREDPKVVEKCKKTTVKKLPKEFQHRLTTAGRSKYLSPEERKKFAATGGKATKGIPRVKYKKCNGCEVKDECEFFVADGTCQIERKIRKRLMSKPEDAFIELGFATPREFFANLAKDVVRLRQSIADRDDNPKDLALYIDKMIAIAKLLYGEKHLNINVNADNQDNVLDLEKILLEQRKKVSYDPKTGKMPDVVEAEFEVEDD